MEIQLANPTWRWLFLLGILFAAATLVLSGAKNGLAEHWAQSDQPEDWLRAVELEPGNADYWYRLGRYRQLDFEHADLPLAISYYRRAVAVDPRSAGNWVALATAYEIAGDSVQARQAFEAAKAAYPISSEVAWRYGNFLLRQNQLPEAFAEIRRGVATDPRLAGLALSRCLRASNDTEHVFDEALPPEVDVYLEALSFLVPERELDAALLVWDRLVRLRPPFEVRRALPLIDALIERNRIEPAQHVWQQALQLAGWTTASSPGDSLVWDGGFERNFVDGGFGWRHLPIEGASFEFDTATVHSGSRSLRITFDGRVNVDFHNLLQLIPAKPRTRYRLTAYLRTEEISTDSGVRLWVVDPLHGGLNLVSPNLLGSRPWTLQELEFTTGPETQVVEITLRRFPSEKFDNQIRGTVWVDDVSLVELAEPGVHSPP
jgi:hypothetical protein